ncbi:LAMI_0D11474g1_1 [Lachancea mirantina]|uniref:LAMI_0D11474g1_1 n=1 Tax=Lachancea mirantina TaxID=1230905 RepID=A0A1G4JF33_9SACH|nr:LAMI_0D11474g1_1 [Lachancea mirantina]
MRRAVIFQILWIGILFVFGIAANNGANFTSNLLLIRGLSTAQMQIFNTGFQNGNVSANGGSSNNNDVPTTSAGLIKTGDATFTSTNSPLTGATGLNSESGVNARSSADAANSFSTASISSPDSHLFSDTLMGSDALTPSPVESATMPTLADTSKTSSAVPSFRLATSSPFAGTSTSSSLESFEAATSSSLADASTSSSPLASDTPITSSLLASDTPITSSPLASDSSRTSSPLPATISSATLASTSDPQYTSDTSASSIAADSYSLSTSNAPSGTPSYNSKAVPSTTSTAEENSSIYATTESRSTPPSKHGASDSFTSSTLPLSSVTFSMSPETPSSDLPITISTTALTTAKEQETASKLLPSTPARSSTSSPVETYLITAVTTFPIAFGSSGTTSDPELSTLEVQTSSPSDTEKSGTIPISSAAFSTTETPSTDQKGSFFSSSASSTIPTADLIGSTGEDMTPSSSMAFESQSSSFVGDSTSSLPTIYTSSPPQDSSILESQSSELVYTLIQESTVPTPTSTPLASYQRSTSSPSSMGASQNTFPTPISLSTSGSPSSTIQPNQASTVAQSQPNTIINTHSSTLDSTSFSADTGRLPPASVTSPITTIYTITSTTPSQKPTQTQTQGDNSQAPIASLTSSVQYTTQTRGEAPSSPSSFLLTTPLQETSYLFSSSLGPQSGQQTSIDLATSSNAESFMADSSTQSTSLPVTVFPNTDLSDGTISLSFSSTPEIYSSKTESAGAFITSTATMTTALSASQSSPYSKSLAQETSEPSTMLSNVDLSSLSDSPTSEALTGSIASTATSTGTVTTISATTLISFNDASSSFTGSAVLPTESASSGSQLESNSITTDTANGGKLSTSIVSISSSIPPVTQSAVTTNSQMTFSQQTNTGILQSMKTRSSNDGGEHTLQTVSPTAYASTQASSLSNSDELSSQQAGSGTTGSGESNSGWLPFVIVTESTMSNPSSATGSFDAGATATLPQVISPSTPVSQPPNYTLITVGFTEPLNYPFLIRNPLASAQIFNFLPLVLCYPFNYSSSQVSARDLRPVIDSSVSKAQSSRNELSDSFLQQRDTFMQHGNRWKDVDFSQVVVGGIIPTIIPNKDYIASVAIVYFPSRAVNVLQKMVLNNNSRLYNNPVPYEESLAALIDPSVPLTGLINSDGSSGGGQTGNGNQGNGGSSSGSGSQSGSKGSGGSGNWAISGSLDNSQKTAMTFKITKRLVIFLPVFGAVIASWLIVVLYLGKKIYKVDTLDHILYSTDKKWSAEHPLARTKLKDLEKLKYKQHDPEKYAHDYYENFENDDTESFDPDDLVSVGDNLYYSRHSGLSYTMGPDGNLYYAGLSYREATSAEDAVRQNYEDTARINERKPPVEKYQDDHTPRTEAQSIKSEDIEIDEDGNIEIFVSEEDQAAMDTYNTDTVESYNNKGRYHPNAFMADEGLVNQASSSEEQQPGTNSPLNSLLLKTGGNIMFPSSHGSNSMPEAITNENLEEFFYGAAEAQDLNCLENVAFEQDDDVENFIFEDLGVDVTTSDDEDVNDVNDVNVGDFDELDEVMYNRLSRLSGLVAGQPSTSDLTTYQGILEQQYANRVRELESVASLYQNPDQSLLTGDGSSYYASSSQANPTSTTACETFDSAIRPEKTYKALRAHKSTTQTPSHSSGFTFNEHTSGELLSSASNKAHKSKKLYRRSVRGHTRSVSCNSADVFLKSSEPNTSSKLHLTPKLRQRNDGKSNSKKKKKISVRHSIAESFSSSIVLSKVNYSRRTSRASEVGPHGHTFEDLRNVSISGPISTENSLGWSAFEND